ncbi:hypothetical protein GIB67_020361, partial [Kingdonia uniflora]
VQLHCLAVKTGFDVYVYVGHSLISLYSRCGDLDSSYNVFDKISMRNAVTWTAIIASFAQHWEIEMCLELYHRMRCSALNPNDYTLTSLFSSCTGTGVLGHGKNANCQTIRMGFELYAQHGVSERAINLLEEMEKGKIEPDAIAFLGIHSSCCYLGLVKEGHVCFSLMFQHGVQPAMDHYSCIMDLLCRCGLLDEALELSRRCPLVPMQLYGAYSFLLLGFMEMSTLESPRYRQLVVLGTRLRCNLLTACKFLCEYRVLGQGKIVKNRGLKTYMGNSWIELRNEVYRFGVEGMSNDKVNDILGVVDGLSDNMRRFGYVPNILEEGLDL